MFIAKNVRFLSSIENVLVEELSVNKDLIWPAFSKFISDNEESVTTVSWDSLTNWLRDSGSKDKWNHIFETQRSDYLGRWSIEHIAGDEILDYLCGNGKLGKFYEANGADVTYVERASTYTLETEQFGDKFVDFENFEVVENSFDTVVLSTVLHHEADYKKLLGNASLMARRRVIVIENCITDIFDDNFQVTIDLFFNQCLNDTLLENPFSHKSGQEWIWLAKEYGLNLSSHLTVPRVPGIPMQHDMLVFEVEGG